MIFRCSCFFAIKLYFCTFLCIIQTKKSPAKSMGVVLFLGRSWRLEKHKPSTLVKFQDQGLPHKNIQQNPWGSFILGRSWRLEKHPYWIPSHHGVPPKIGDFWFGRCASGHRGRSLARSWNGQHNRATHWSSGAVKILYDVDIFYNSKHYS